MNLFGRRKGMNRRMMWSSILSLGMSAAAYGLNRRRTNTHSSGIVQGGLMKNRNMSMLQQAMAEFANEIAPDNKFNKR
ncbi:hypothetical protein FZC84_10960 [Rossellomorea vietnamensis]|uniref:Uncharacterized protein n=1 Tax=Rossellomorea vietnamensis TaxID=218284 RepID=A0A5D4MBD9_9BACI|nr:MULTISPECIES: hypothetical protein [Bacillaceae]TYR99269.1 hypothetical protein FZC84_10960 [Rossellomorea vietnamensis]